MYIVIPCMHFYHDGMSGSVRKSRYSGGLKIQANSVHNYVFTVESLADITLFILYCFIHYLF